MTWLALSHALKQLWLPGQGQDSQNPSIDGIYDLQAPPYTEDLLAVASCLGREIIL